MTSGRLKSERKPAAMTAAARRTPSSVSPGTPAVTRRNARHATLAGSGKSDEGDPAVEVRRVGAEVHFVSRRLVRGVEVGDETAVLRGGFLLGDDLGQFVVLVRAVDGKGRGPEPRVPAQR